MLMKLCTLLALIGLSLTSAQTCTNPSPTLTPCSTTLQSTVVPAPWFSANFSVNPLIANPSAVYGWSQTGVNDTACGVSAYHQGILQLTGSSSNSATLGPSVNLTATSGANSIGQVLPGYVGGTSPGDISAGTAGWTFEVTFKALQQTNWAKVFDIGVGDVGGDQDILFGWQSNTLEMVFTDVAATNNGPTLRSVIPTTQLGVWYHVVISIQELTATTANYYIYVNGQLNAQLLNTQYPAAVPRPSANLGRSNWPDSYWVGEIDTFNIYNYALNVNQASALAQAALGGCTVTYGTNFAALPAPSSTPPSPFFELTFASNPLTSTASGLSWVNADPDDVTCGLSANHQGVLVLPGTFQSVGPYGNLSAPSTDPYYLGGTLPVIGGAAASGTSVNSQTAGWSIEITFKANLYEAFAKLFDISATRSNINNCQYDILFGYFNDNGGLQFETCDGNSNQFAVNDFVNPIVLGRWYHMVFAIQQLGSGLANYNIYVNGQLSGQGTGMWYPQAVVRSNANIGKSGWNDAYFPGVLDTFRVFNQALNQPQAQSLFNTAFTGSSSTTPNATVATGFQCPLTTPPTSIPSNAVFYKVDFASDPRPAAVGTSGGADYQWMASDPSDSSAAAAVHQGLINLNDTTSSGLTPYINLTATSGVNSVSTTRLPVFGGSGSGLMSQASVGWSFELVFKPLSYGSSTNYAKFYDLNNGQCVNDVLLGWIGTTNNVSFTVCSGNGNQATIQAMTNVQPGQWYHSVVTVSLQAVKDNAGLGLGTYTSYVNGVRVASQSDLTFINSYDRPSANLGKSSWPDAYFNGTYDSFAIYSVALNPAQVMQRYNATMTASQPTIASSSSSAATVASSASSASGRSSSASAPSSSAPSSSSSSSSTGGSPVVIVSTGATTTPTGSTTGTSSGAVVPSTANVVITSSGGGEGADSSSATTINANSAVSTSSLSVAVIALMAAVALLL